MATYAVAANEVGVHGKTLVANAVDIVQFASNHQEVEVHSNGLAAIFVRVDGSSPAVNGAFAEILPAGVVSSRILRIDDNDAFEVRLISSGTPTYSVTRVAA